MRSIIQLQDVTRTFEQGERTFTALRNVSLKIGPGQFVAIVGESGSGKSTMLNLITGIDHPTSGCVKVNDSEIHRFSENELARWRGRNVGIVFQFFQLIPTLTIHENILLALEFVRSVPKSDRDGRVSSLLEMVGILDHADKFPSALSGGEQQRAAIARALANDPGILVADEPTGNLDSVTAASVKAIFADLASQGKTVVMVTHANIDDQDFDQVIRLRDGEVHPVPASTAGLQ